MQFSFHKNAWSVSVNLIFTVFVRTTSFHDSKIIHSEEIKHRSIGLEKHFLVYPFTRLQYNYNKVEFDTYLTVCFSTTMFRNLFLFEAPFLGYNLVAHQLQFTSVKFINWRQPWSFFWAPRPGWEPLIYLTYCPSCQFHQHLWTTNCFVHPNILRAAFILHFYANCIWRTVQNKKAYLTTLPDKSTGFFLTVLPSSFNAKIGIAIKSRCNIPIKNWRLNVTIRGI